MIYNKPTMEIVVGRFYNHIAVKHVILQVTHINGNEVELIEPATGWRGSMSIRQLEIMYKPYVSDMDFYEDILRIV